jgi:hypothetical protein
MSKSTPLSQLPNMGSQNVLLNDPQRLSQSQAQAPPQSNMQASGPIQDPEEIIQETLNQINGQMQTPHPPQQMPQPPQVSQLEQYEAQQPLIYDPNMFAMPPTQQSLVDSNISIQTVGQQEPTSKLLNDLASWNNDIQVGLFAAALYILISMTPIESIIYKYIALDKLPYSNVVIKAAMMFVLMLVFLKFFK